MDRQQIISDLSLNQVLGEVRGKKQGDIFVGGDRLLAASLMVCLHHPMAALLLGTISTRDTEGKVPGSFQKIFTEP